MSDPIERAVGRTSILAYMIGGAAASVVAVFDLSILWAVFIGGISAIPVVFIERWAKRKIYGHVYDAIRLRQGWV